MNSDNQDTDCLVRMAAAGDQPARAALLARHRRRLRRMVSARIDRRMAARIDPSDVVQETMVEATRRLPQYLTSRPMPYYAWLQLLATQKLADLHRRHVQAARRSVRREEPGLAGLSGRSAIRLAARLAGSVSSPSKAILHEELQALLERALARLDRRDQDVLRLRHLEQLSTADTAAVMGLTPDAVRARQRRALERLTAILQEQE